MFARGLTLLFRGFIIARGFLLILLLICKFDLDLVSPPRECDLFPPLNLVCPLPLP